MSAPNGTKSYVTTTELADKLASLRWEMRAYVLLIVLGVLLKFQTPSASVARHAVALLNPF